MGQISLGFIVVANNVLQLRNAIVKRGSAPCLTMSYEHEDERKKYSRSLDILGHSREIWLLRDWTPDDNKARSETGFDEQKREIERNKKEVDNMKEEMRKFREGMNVQPVRKENNEPIIADQHYALSDFTQFQSTQGHVNSSYFNMGTPPNFQTPMQSQPGSSVWQRQMPVQSATQYWQPDTTSQPGSYYSFGQVPFHMGRQNLQTTSETHDDVDGIFYQNIPNRGRREQFPSKYKLTSFMEQPPTTNLPKERVNKTKNKGKKANLSPLNLGGAFEDDNVEENNVTFLGSQFTEKKE
ncbi:hypothetical protein Tco_0303848 [Tanacetum coccineum]